VSVSDTPTSKHRPSLVVFDLAGTTVQDENRVAGFLMEAMAHIGHPVSLTEANSVMGERKPKAIAQLLTPRLGLTSMDSDIVQRGNAEFLRLTNAYYATSPEVGEIPGASAVFAALHGAGIKVACDTGFERSTVDVILKRLGWLERGLIDTAISSDEVPHGRPAPDLIHEAMRRTGVTDVTRVAKVGDTPSDIGEGRSAGCSWVIAVTYGTHRRSQLEPHQPTHFIDTLPGILPLLNLAS
jgi:hypothetical protein